LQLLASTIGPSGVRTYQKSSPSNFSRTALPHHLIEQQIIPTKDKNWWGIFASITERIPIYPPIANTDWTYQTRDRKRLLLPSALDPIP